MWALLRIPLVVGRAASPWTLLALVGLPFIGAVLRGFARRRVRGGRSAQVGDRSARVARSPSAQTTLWVENLSSEPLLFYGVVECPPGRYIQVTSREGDGERFEFLAEAGKIRIHTADPGTAAR